MKCSYCHTEMKIADVQEKRPVPSGAKDLGLTDKVTCWQCPKCSLTAKLDYKKCGKCGAIVGPKEVPNRAGVLLVEDDLAGGGCTNCIRCRECHLTINHSELCTEFEEHTYHSSGGTVWREGGEFAGGDGLAIRRKRVFYHKSCYKAMKDRVKTEAERRHTEAVEHAVKNGLCMECGKAVGVMDKLAKRQQHKNC